MKKILSVILSVVMVFALAIPAFATEPSKTFSFNQSGKFKIMMINDTQDTIYKDSMQAKFLKKAVAEQKPDLLVLVGDQLTDFLPLATKKTLTFCLRQALDEINSLGVPFAATFGNHDHDWDDKGKLTLDEQMEIYKSYSNYVSVEGFNNGTYNIPVKSSDGKSIALNIYMLDSNNKASGEGLLTGYEGLKPEQVQWYKETRDSLALANGGKAVPSFVFQHVPVKEIYQFVDEYEFNASAAERENAVFSIDDFKWYKLNDKITDGVIGEVPCSESRGGHTGEYEAWLEKGEIIGAFFGHDHVNNFTGTTDEGIRMGYNGGLGFSTYGRGSDRSARIFEIDENDVENYNTFEYTYKDCTGKDFSFFITDLISPVALSYVGKVLAVILPSFVKDIIAK